MPTDPKQVNQMLGRMNSTADQEKYLASLPETDLEAYANWAEQEYAGRQTQGTGGEVGGRPVVQTLDQDLESLSDEQLERIAQGADPAEVTQPQPEIDQTKGFLDTGVGLGGRGLLLGLGALGGLALDPVLPEGETVAGMADKLADNLGLRRPENSTDRVVQDIFAALAQVGGIKAAGTGLSAIGQTGAAAGKGVGGMAARGAGKLGDILRFDRGFKVAPGLMGSEAAVGTIAGTGASGYAREIGADDTTQLIAGLLAGAAPGVAKSTTDYGVKKVFGAGSSDQKQQIAENLAKFNQVEVPPTLAEASQHPRNQRAQAFLSTMAGTGGIVRNAGLAQDEAIAKRVLSDAERLAPGADPTEAGFNIREGIEGYTDPAKAATLSKPEDYVFGWRPRQQRQINDAWGRFSREFEPGWMVDTTKIAKTLEKRLRINPNDPGKFAAAADGDRAFYEDWYQRLKTNMDTNAPQHRPEAYKPDGTPILDDTGQFPKVATRPGGTPFESLQQARTDLGTQIESALLNGEKSAGQLRQMYGLLSEALEDGLKTMDKARGSRAKTEWDKATALTKDYHETLEIIGNVAAKEGGFENVFKLAVGGTAPVPGQMKIGGTRIFQVMKNLEKPQRQVFAAAILKRLGGQGENNFSLDTFVKNWDVMDPNAREAVMSVVPKTMRKDYETIVEVGRNILEGRKDFGIATKPKEGGRGTSFFIYPLIALSGGIVTQATSMAGGAEFMSALPAAGATAAAGAGLVLLTGRSLAKKMTDPKFVRWLAKSTELPKSAIPMAITQLMEQARQDNDPELMKLAEYYRQQGQE